MLHYLLLKSSNITAQHWWGSDMMWGVHRRELLENFPVAVTTWMLMWTLFRLETRNYSNFVLTLGFCFYSVRFSITCTSLVMFSLFSHMNYSDGLWSIIEKTTKCLKLLWEHMMCCQWRTVIFIAERKRSCRWYLFLYIYYSNLTIVFSLLISLIIFVFT